MAKHKRKGLAKHLRKKRKKKEQEAQKNGTV